MPVAMQLSRIIISEVNDQQVIYLKEIGGERTFPILIGLFEAMSINRRVKGEEYPRPLTHDLIVGVAENLGGELQDVVISELKEHTYSATTNPSPGRVGGGRCPAVGRHSRGSDLQSAAADIRQRGCAQRRPGGVGITGTTGSAHRVHQIAIDRTYRGPILLRTPTPSRQQTL